MSRYTVKKGSLDPLSLVVNVASSDAVPDLSLVTAAELTVTDRSTGAVSTWTVTIGAQSAIALPLIHPYVTADTATIRVLKIDTMLTITGAANPVPADSFLLAVVE